MFQNFPVLPISLEFSVAKVDVSFSFIISGELTLGTGGKAFSFHEPGLDLILSASSFAPTPFAIPFAGGGGGDRVGEPPAPLTDC